MDYRRTKDEQIHHLFTPPIALDAGKLDVTQAFGGYLLAGALFVVALVCAVVAVACWPLASSGDGVGYRVVGAVFGVVLAFLALRSAWGIWHSVDRGFRRYDDFLEEVRTAWLDAAEALRGNPTYTFHEEETFSMSFPALFTLAVAITWSLSERNPQRRPWSVDALQGPFTLTIPAEQGTGERYIHCGRLSAADAEAVGRTFARLGLIEGRRSRSAGQWVPSDANEVYTLMTDHWAEANLPLARSGK